MAITAVVDIVTYHCFRCYRLHCDCTVLSLSTIVTYHCFRCYRPHCTVLSVLTIVGWYHYLSLWPMSWSFLCLGSKTTYSASQQVDWDFSLQTVKVSSPVLVILLCTVLECSLVAVFSNQGKLLACVLRFVQVNCNQIESNYDIMFALAEFYKIVIFSYSSYQFQLF